MARRPPRAPGMMLMPICQRCPAAASTVGGTPGSGPPLQPVKLNIRPVMAGPQCRRRRRRNIPRAVARGAAGALPAPPLAGLTPECVKAGPNTGRRAGWDRGTSAVTASQSRQQQRAISTASWRHYGSAGHNRGCFLPLGQSLAGQGRRRAQRSGAGIGSRRGSKCSSRGKQCGSIEHGVVRTVEEGLVGLGGERGRGGARMQGAVRILTSPRCAAARTPRQGVAGRQSPRAGRRPRPRVTALTCRPAGGQRRRPPPRARPAARWTGARAAGVARARARPAPAP